MDYFYCAPEKFSKDSLLIDGDEYAHLVHVMRKKEGDEIRVVDGCGTAYDVRLGVLKKHMAHATILNILHSHNEPSLSVTLAIGVLKNPSKFDFLVEKVTELGVKEIIPLTTKRTISKHAKVERWQKLALAAMKQCGRSYLPSIHKLTTLSDLLMRDDHFDYKMIAHEKSNNTMTINNALTKSNASVLILVGPEGGFDDEEFEECIRTGFNQMYFGERRLRTETAAIVATSFILMRTYF